MHSSGSMFERYRTGSKCITIDNGPSLLSATSPVSSFRVPLPSSDERFFVISSMSSTEQRNNPTAHLLAPVGHHSVLIFNRGGCQLLQFGTGNPT